jgi:hypothetical protein
MKRSFILAGLAIALMSSSAMADGGNIWTGGKDGAYNSTFCPPLPNALADKDFPNYRCATSGGTLDNIQKVLTKPTDLGFVQLDVYAREQQDHPEYKDKLTIIRKDIACEGLWMVTKRQVQNFGDILGGRKTPFVLPPEVSGSAASFKFVQSIDPDGLARAKNIRYVDSAKAVIETVAASQDRAVGFFVQWADPRNDNIKLMQERELNVVPVYSREILGAKIDGQDLYSVQSYSLTEGGWVASAKQATTACTPVAIITGNPAAQKDRDAVDDQKLMIKTMQDIPSDKLLPKDSRLASLMKSVRSITASSMSDALAAVDAAKKAAIKATSGQD